MNDESNSDRYLKCYSVVAKQSLKKKISAVRCLLNPLLTSKRLFHSVCFQGTQLAIAHFRVDLSLSIKSRPAAEPFM